MNKNKPLLTIFLLLLNSTSVPEPKTLTSTIFLKSGELVLNKYISAGAPINEKKAKFQLLIFFSTDNSSPFRLVSKGLF